MTEELSSKFAEALQYAFELHAAQRRKGSGIPYMGHVLGVAALTIEDGGSEEEAIAALLHDGPEDVAGLETLAEIEERFGHGVAGTVAACSDTFESPKPAWRTRKERYIEHLREASSSTLRVSLADKLFNARALVRDYRVVGDELWERFAEGEQSQLWYYGALSVQFRELLPGPMADELWSTVDDLRRLVETKSRLA